MCSPAGKQEAAIQQGGLNYTGSSSSSYSSVAAKLYPSCVSSFLFAFLFFPFLLSNSLHLSLHLNDLIFLSSVLPLLLCLHLPFLSLVTSSLSSLGSFLSFYLPSFPVLSPCSSILPLLPFLFFSFNIHFFPPFDSLSA